MAETDADKFTDGLRIMSAELTRLRAENEALRDLTRQVVSRADYAQNGGDRPDKLEFEDWLNEARQLLGETK